MTKKMGGLKLSYSDNNRVMIRMKENLKDKKSEETMFCTDLPGALYIAWDILDCCIKSAIWSFGTKLKKKKGA